MGVTHSFVTEWDNAPKTVTSFPRDHTPETARNAFLAMQNHAIPTIEDFVWACEEAAERFNTMPNLVEVPLRPKDRVLFVGDLHGCFEAMIRMFSGWEEEGISPVGFPGPNDQGGRNVYLFNGDLVDRGGSGYQIVFALALLSRAFPDCVYINRGNHESEMFGLSVQAGFGNKFMLEIASKFPDIDYSVYKPAVSDLFYSLPLAHVFDRNIFVCHGGVPMVNDLTGVRLPQASYFGPPQPPQLPRNAKPYLVSNLEKLTPTRQETANFEDTPRNNSELWHSLVWSYDRQPYSAEFMEANGYKCMVHSHTATPYHQITTFLPIDKPNEKFGTQSVVKSDEMFDKAKSFFATHPNASRVKLCIMEIFTSPTNAGAIYVAEADVKEGPPGSMMDFDPFNWEYHCLGQSSSFKFIQDQPAY